MRKPRILFNNKPEGALTNQNDDSRIIYSGIILLFILIFMLPFQVCSADNHGKLKNTMADTLLYDSTFKAKVYGFPPFILTNNVPGDTVIYTSSNPQIVLISGDTATIKGAGVVNITGQIKGDSLSSVTKKLTIYQKTINVSTPDVWRLQGQANPKFVIIYSGFVKGEDESAFTSAPVALCNANAGSPPGKYPIAFYGGSATNYSFWFDKTDTLTVAGLSLDKNYNQVTLYPNPARENVTVTGINGPSTVIICDAGGAGVKTLKLEQGGSFSVSDLVKGIYLVKIVSTSGTIIKKLIVN